MFFANRLPPKVLSAYKKDSVAGILAAVMYGLTMPFLAVIARDDLHATEIQIAVITVAQVAANILSFVWANIAEGKRKMPYAVASWVISRGILCATVFAYTANAFVIMITAFWLVSSIAIPPYSALMKEIYPDSDRGRIMGYVRVWSGLVWLVIALVAGRLLDVVSYRYVFPIAGLFGIVSALTFGSIPTSQTSGDSSVNVGKFTMDSFKILVKDGGYRWFCGGVFIAGWANFFTLSLYPIYQVDVLHVNKMWAAVYSITTLAVTMISFYYWGHRVDRKSPSYIVGVCNNLFAFIPLIYYVSSNKWMLLPAMVIAGICNAGSELAYFNGVLLYAPEGRVTQYQAIFTFLLGFRGLTATFLGAKLIELHWLTMQQAFLITAALAFMSYPILMIGEKKYRSIEAFN